MLGLGRLAGLVASWALLYGLFAWLYRRRTLRRDWHRDVLAVGVLVLGVLAFYWPLFFTESWIPKGGGDLSSFIYPIYAFAARWLKRGVIPLWNPHLYLGMPFAADNQSGLFYPINLLFFLIAPELTYETVELMAVTHVFLAGLFTYLFLRDLPSPRLFPGRASLSLSGAQPPRIGRTAAVGGAMVYMFSDLFVIHPGNLNIIATATWLPLALLCFYRAMDRRSWGWAVCSGIVLGIAALVGHAQMFLYVAITLGLYAAFRLYLGWHEGLKAALVRAGQLGLAGAVAFGLAALSLIPAYDMTRYTVRASMSYAQASDFALPPAGLVSLLVPGFFGRGTGTFWGPWLRTEMGYVGVLPLVLAAIAVALTFRHYPLTRFWLIVAGFGVFVALGSYSAMHGWLYVLVPMFRQLRVPARAIFAFDFAAAMLAAVGLDLLLHPLARRARRTLAALNRGLMWIGGGLAVAGVPLLGHAVIVARTSPSDVQAQNVAAMGSLIFFLILLGAGLGVLALRRHRLARRSTIGVLAMCLIAFDLISMGAYVEIEPNDPLTGYSHASALAFLRADPDVFRVETAAEVQGGWAPDWTLLHEMDDFSGIWNPLRLGAYDVLTWAGIGRESSFYNLYNVKYFITSRDVPVPAHFEPVFEDGAGTIYRNTHVLPRAFMVYRARVIGGDIAALNTVRGSDFDPSTEIVLKKGGSARPLDVDPGEGERGVEIVGRGPNHLDFQVITPVEGYLFVSEMWLPGWVAYVDGEPQEVLKADYTFRALYVPPGRHAIHMVYRPRPWFMGLGLTLATLVALCAWGIWALVRRRKAPAGHDAGSSLAGR